MLEEPGENVGFHLGTLFQFGVREERNIGIITDREIVVPVDDHPQHGLFGIRNGSFHISPFTELDFFLPELHVLVAIVFDMSRFICYTMNKRFFW